MNVPLLASAAVVGFGVYAFYTKNSSSSSSSKTPALVDTMGSTTSGAKAAFAGFGITSLKLQSAEMVNHNTRRLRFALPEGSSKSGLTLSSALLTISFPGGGWIPTLRPYTPVSDLDEPGHIDFLVKHYPGGKGSTHMHSMQPGESLRFLPIPGYKWKANEHEHIGLIAGGAGITPMYQLARGILKNPDERTRITLVWGVNTDEDVFLAKEFADLEKQHPGRFKAVYTVSQAAPGSRYRKGYVTKELLEEVGLGKTGAAEKDSDVKLFVCGPPAMEKALIKGGVLAEMGYGKGEFHKF